MTGESDTIPPRRVNVTKVMRCRDVGPDCDFEAKGNTEEEVLQQVAVHAGSAHGITDIPADMLAKVKAAIHNE